MPCALPSAGSKLAAKSDRTRLRGLSHALAVPPAFVSKAAPSCPGSGHNRFPTVSIRDQANPGARISGHRCALGVATLKTTIS
jgi:hypothetical protein